MKKLIPAGSIVLLKNAVKRLMVIGILQQKKEYEGEVPLVYDYIGVPYPEGYIGPDNVFLFNHEDIEEIVFTGFEDSERTGFFEVLSTVYGKAEETVEKAEESTDADND